MKNCPYCHTAIEDNARFCLYCMRELEEKAVFRPKPVKIWLLLLLLPLLAAGIVLILTQAAKSGSNKPSASIQSDKTGLMTAPEEPSPAFHLDAENEQIIYTYKKTEQFSVFGENDPLKDIVITGVQTATADGVYRIPATIDGKTVVAVDEGAFSAADIAETVRAVYLPKTVKGICRGAFWGCSGLSELYIASERIIIDSGAFESMSSRTEGITVFSSADCENGSGSLLSALYTDADGFSWEEWDGGTT